MLGSYKKAIEYHEMALSIAIETGDKYRESDSYECLHRAYRSLGNTEKAKECRDKYMRLNKQIGTSETLREV